MTKNIIKIGLPSKGRLKHNTIDIFKKNKLRLASERGERDLLAYVEEKKNQATHQMENQANLTSPHISHQAPNHSSTTKQNATTIL